MRRFFPLSSSPELTSTSSPSPGLGNPISAQNVGLPAELLLPILKEVRDDVKDINEALAQVELRMVAGSVLIIYESDWTRARIGLERHVEYKSKLVSGATEDDDSEESSDNEDGDKSEKNEGPAYVVKLIDFAHTKLTPGLGPDEGVLKGFNTVLSLLDGRIREVEELSPAKVQP
jgi:inositol-polyphosphate multikinase